MQLAMEAEELALQQLSGDDFRVGPTFGAACTHAMQEDRSWVTSVADARARHARLGAFCLKRPLTTAIDLNLDPKSQSKAAMSWFLNRSRVCRSQLP